MLTLDEYASSRPTDASVNKVILVRPSVSDLQAMEFLRIFLREPEYDTFGCASAWLLHWAMQHVQNRKPISPEHKTNKAGSFERPQHFFSAKKLDMRNAP